MKKTCTYITVMLFIMFIKILGILNVSAATNPYKESGPYGTNCTCYAWKMANEKAGVILPGWGNAKNWFNDAKDDGYTVGTTPKANSIIVWGDWTSYGHVGYVESVEGDVLHIWDSTGPCIDEEDEAYRECMANSVSEESDKICKANAKRIACEYSISPSRYSVTGYIYLDYAPQKQSHSSSQNTTSNKESSSSSVEVTKSSNAYLSSIVFSNGTIEFVKDIFEYKIELENEVDTISINATSEDKKATIKGVGDYELDIGLNEIELLVTAEDGNIKKYSIQVIRNEKIEVELNTDTNNIQIDEAMTENNNQSTFSFMLGVCFLVFLGVGLIFIFYKKIVKKKK